MTISVRKIKDKPYVQVSVKDTGLGIPPEDVKKLFGKFFRSSNALTKKRQDRDLGFILQKYN